MPSSANVICIITTAKIWTMKPIRADREVTGGPVLAAMNFVDEEDHDDHAGRVNPHGPLGRRHHPKCL
jgi:hypothetical protein